ncbi:MAG: GNAT family N-acetyltransferase [Alphaproteobacteria bacterium]
MDLKIRKAKENDIKVIAQNVLNVALEGSNETLCKNKVLEAVQSFLKTPESGVYYVAESNHKIIGSLMIQKEWSDYKNGYRWWIHSVYVDPKYRRQGVYKAMYSHIKKQAQKSENVIGLNLYTDENNKPAQKAYEKLGMINTRQIVYTDTDVK